jgi:hypothetical protein
MPKVTDEKYFNNSIAYNQKQIAQVKSSINTLNSIQEDDYEAFCSEVHDYLSIEAIVEMLACYNAVDSWHISDFKLPPFKEIARQIKMAESRIKSLENTIEDLKKRKMKNRKEHKVDTDALVKAMVKEGMDKEQAKKIVELNTV